MMRSEFIFGRWERYISNLNRLSKRKFKEFKIKKGKRNVKFFSFYNWIILSACILELIGTTLVLLFSLVVDKDRIITFKAIFREMKK